MGGKRGPDPASLGAFKRARLLSLEGRTQAAFFHHVKAAKWRREQASSADSRGASCSQNVKSRVGP